MPTSDPPPGPPHGDVPREVSGVPANEPTAPGAQAPGDALAAASPQGGRVRLPGAHVPSGEASLAGDLSDLTAALALARQESELARSMALRFESELEAERKRVARDVGDGLAAQVAAMKSLARTLEHRLSASEPSLSQIASLLRGNADTLLTDIRHIVRRMRPETLVGSGLAPALRALVDDWRLRRPKARYELLIEPADDERFGLGEPDVEAVAHRFVDLALQDAGQPALWHATIGLVVVSVRVGEGALTVQVVHDGRPLQGGADRLVEGPAWVELIERLHGLGGRLSVADATDDTDVAGATGGVELIAVMPWPVEL